MAELVRVRREGAVAVLTLNRPEKLNALSSSVEEALAAAVGSEEVATSAALVIEGSGRAFSAGADVHEMREQSVAAILEYYGTTGVVYDRVAALRQPTIAAIHGYCLGGGFELALACDFRIADATAVFGLPEVAIGIVPSSGGLTRLVRSVRAARAKELMLLPEPVRPPGGPGLGAGGGGRARGRGRGSRDRDRQRARAAAASSRRGREARRRRRGGLESRSVAADRAPRPPRAGAG